MFYPKNRLVSLWILIYQESTVAAPISSLAIAILFFLLAWTTDSILKSTLCRDFQHKTISGIFVELSKKPPYFCLLELILK